MFRRPLTIYLLKTIFHHDNPFNNKHMYINTFLFFTNLYTPIYTHKVKSS